MDRIFNVGLVGVGEHAWDNLLPSLAAIKYVNILAVCDTDEAKANTAARNYGATSYTNMIDMLDHEQLDAVIAASHPNVHKEVLKETIVRKIPVFVEKPPTLFTSELEELVELNKGYNTLTSVGFNFNFSDPVNFIRDMLKSSEFGKLQYMRISHLGSKPNNTIWGLESKARSFLLAQAIHPLGLLYFLGNPTDETSVIRCQEGDRGLMFNVNLVLEDINKNKFTAELLTTSMSPYFEWQLQLLGSNGVLVYVNSLWEVEVYSANKPTNELIPNSKWWRDTWRPSPLSNGFKRTGYENHFHEFFKNIIENKKDRDSIENVLPVYYLMDEMEKTYEKNCKK